MSKPSERKESPKPKKEPFVIKKDIEAAMRLENQLQVEPDLSDQFSMFIMSFTAMGLMKGTPAVNFVAVFILLSFYINRNRTASWFSQSLISMGMVLASCGMLYYRMMTGTLPIPK